MSIGMDIFDALISTIFVETEGVALSTTEEVESAYVSTLSSLGLQSYERVWVDDMQIYTVLCQHGLELHSSIFYAQHDCAGLCWSEGIYDAHVAPYMPDYLKGMYHAEMRGYIHYDIRTCARLASESCAALGVTLTTEVVRRHSVALVAHERRHWVQDPSEMVLTSSDPRSEEYQDQGHELDANFAALVALLGSI